jgi:hypothetical protein
MNGLTQSVTVDRRARLIAFGALIALLGRFDQGCALEGAQ